MASLPYRLKKPSPDEKSVASPSRSTNHPDSTHQPVLPFLPDEIWDHIFSFMQATYPNPIGYHPWKVKESLLVKSKKSVVLLAKFCRTSKRFHRLATPRLYNQPPLWGSVQNTWIGQHWNREFFRAISQQPDRAQCVKEARLGFRQTDAPYVWKTFQNVLGGLSQPSDIVTRMATVFREGITRPTHRAIWDAETAFYVLLIPRVKRLELGVSEKHLLVLALLMLPPLYVLCNGLLPIKPISPLGPPLTCLKVLHVKSLSTTNRLVDIRRLSLCLKIPTLESFIATNVVWDGPPDSDFPETNQNLKTIHIHSSHLHDLAFRYMLSQFPNLQSLKVEGGAIRGGPPGGNFNYLGGLLRSHGRKLECLEFNNKFTMNYRMIGTLQQLEQLKTLNIAYCTLFTGWDEFSKPSLCTVLPFQLQHLHLHSLRGGQDQQEEVVRELLLDERFLALDVLVVEEFIPFTKDVTGFWVVRWSFPRLHRLPWTQFERIRGSPGLTTDSTSS